MYVESRKNGTDELICKTGKETQHRVFMDTKGKREGGKNRVAWRYVHYQVQNRGLTKSCRTAWEAQPSSVTT